MNAQTVLSYLQAIAGLFLGGLALYFKYSTKAQTKAKQIQETIAEITASAVIYIREAEEEYKDVSNAGGKKFEQVVDKLYALVPEGFNKIITRNMVSDIVQSTFNEVQEYMRLQLDNTIDKIDNK